jgi:hypothetical protein
MRAYLHMHHQRKVEQQYGEARPTDSILTILRVPLRNALCDGNDFATEDSR